MAGDYTGHSPPTGYRGRTRWTFACLADASNMGSFAKTMLLCLSSDGLGEPVVVADGEVVVVAGASFEF